MHVKWISFIQNFIFIFKHKLEKFNRVIDALSQKITCLVNLLAKIIRFDYLKELYPNDKDFLKIL